jgi:hypothetical protein
MYHVLTRRKTMKILAEIILLPIKVIGGIFELFLAMFKDGIEWID